MRDNSLDPRINRGAALRNFFDNRNTACTSQFEFNTATWVASLIAVTPNFDRDPFGGRTASKVERITTTTEAKIRQTTTIGTSNTWTQMLLAKAWVGSWLRFRTLWVGANDAVWYDLRNGRIGTIQAGVITPRMVALGNGWWLIMQAGSVGGTPPGNNLADIALCSADNVDTGVVGESILVAGFSIKVGNWT